MGLKLVDVDKIEKWMEDIENYNYTVLPTKEKQEKMKLILTARYEAYQNVLTKAIK